MDFKMQRNFHPVWSDLYPLPPGKRQLPLQPTPWLKLESSMFLTLFISSESRCTLGSAPWGGLFLTMRDTCKVGRQDRGRRVRFLLQAYGGLMTLPWLLGAGGHGDLTVYLAFCLTFSKLQSAVDSRVTCLRPALCRPSPGTWLADGVPYVSQGLGGDLGSVTR